MCGIFLVYSKNKKINKKKCLKSVSSLKRRGPDKNKYQFFNNNLFIFNSVLSITGKLDTTNKLYRSPNNNFYLTYNGEIYNYKELSKKFFKNRFFSNDSDLLINLFAYIKNKSTFLQSINGMYSFVVYDNKKNKIYFCSDVQGEKRLYKFENNHELVLSSTISAIIDYIGGDKIYPQIFKDYINTRHFNFLENTIYKSITPVEPGKLFEFDFNTLKLINRTIENIFDWIDERRYREFEKMDYIEVIEYFDKLFKEQLSIMIPNRKFGTICSGGIDSSLQTRMISEHTEDYIVGAIHHKGKDKITENLADFERYINKRIQIFNANVKLNYEYAKRCVREISIPFLTHDFVGRYQISNFFKKKNCKVFFCGDGADEIFGGYEAYANLDWSKNKIKNISPYSTYGNQIPNEESALKKKFNIFFMKATEKYSFLNIKEINMQSSLFSDYFLCTRSVYNIGTDLVGCNNSVEPRNMFIQKNILKNAINLPIKYKINQNAKDKRFILKPLLKHIYLKYFPRRLIYKKQGFSGFPNEMKRYLVNKNYYNIKKNLDISKYFKAKLSRSLEWKMVNLELFFEKNKFMKKTNVKKN